MNVLSFELSKKISTWYRDNGMTKWRYKDALKKTFSTCLSCWWLSSVISTKLSSGRQGLSKNWAVCSSEDECNADLKGKARKRRGKKKCDPRSKPKPNLLLLPKSASPTLDRSANSESTADVNRPLSRSFFAKTSQEI